MPCLTIAIPTYNRPNELKTTLSRLICQITDDCELIISDNASEDHLEYIVDSCLQIAAVSKDRVRYIRNKVNIGATANILRCFEHATGDWIWVLGDDDCVAQGAVRDVLDKISSAKDAAYITFLTKRACMNPLVQKRPFVTTGLVEFARDLDDAGGINFMSTSVWKMEAFLPNLHIAYDHAYSMAWSYALLLSSLKCDQKCVFSDRTIIDDVSIADFHNQWSFIPFCLGFNTVLELPMPIKVRDDLSRKMLHTFLPPAQLLSFMLLGTTNNNKEERRFLYRVAARRLSVYFSSPSRLLFWFFGIAFIFPVVTKKLLLTTIAGANKLGITHVNISELAKRSRDK